MLLLWLSLVAMVPFDMSRFDGSGTGEFGQRRAPVVDRILELAKVWLLTHSVIDVLVIWWRVWCLEILASW